MTIAYAKSVTIQNASVNNLNIIMEHLTANGAIIGAQTNITIHGDGQSSFNNSKNYGIINVNYPGTININNSLDGDIICSNSGQIKRGVYSKPEIDAIAVGDIEELDCSYSVTASGFPPDIYGYLYDYSKFNGVYCGSSDSILKNKDNQCDIELRLEIGRTFDAGGGTQIVSPYWSRYVLSDNTVVGSAPLATKWRYSEIAFSNGFNILTETLYFFRNTGNQDNPDVDNSSSIGQINPG